MTQNERALQMECMIRLRSWPVIAIPVPNGLWIPARTAAEKAMVARIITLMKNTGMLVPGAPDLVIIWRDGGGALVELKRAKSKTLLGTKAAGRLSDDQKAIRDQAYALGVNWACCTSWAELEAQLIEWGVPGWYRAAGQ